MLKADLLATGFFAGVLLLPRATHCEPPQAKPTFSVADSIGLTLVADREPICYSPDRSKAALVTKTGDLEHNQVHYRIYIFDAQNSIPKGPTASFSSSSNRPAVEQLRWLNDNKTLTFLGEKPGGPRQAFALSVDSGKVRQLVDYPRSVAKFSTSQDLAKVAFLGHLPPTPLDSPENRKRGLVVTNQRLLDLLIEPGADTVQDYELNLMGQRVNLPPGHQLGWENRILALSPDGQKLVLDLQLNQFPERWSGYQEPWIQSLKAMVAAPPISQLFVVDVKSRTFRPLLDAPFHPGGKVVWSADSRSVLLGRSFAPLQSNLPQAQSDLLAFEASLDGTQQLISSKKICPTQIHNSGKTLELCPWGEPSGPKTWMSKVAGVWTETSSPPANSFRIEIVEDINAAPKIVDSSTKQVLLDLNPGIDRFKLGRVEEFRAPLKSGRVLVGGLFLPPDYSPQRKYPLVIQTHGWTPKKFWPDGNFGANTGYAAQSLCTAGIVVAQISDTAEVQAGIPDQQTGSEGEVNMRAVEGTIDYLDGRGLIDRNKIGLMGWSATCLTVKYMLTHSTYPIAAAVVIEGIDPSYWQYLVYSDIESWQKHCEKLYGGVPWGAISGWSKEAPGFMLDKVNTPVLIQCPKRSTILNDWEWFAGLRRLGKPVEMVTMFDGQHNLFRPSNRLVSQGGAYDWFRFWLQAEPSSDTTQTQRWDRLRQLKTQPTPKS